MHTPLNLQGKEGRKKEEFGTKEGTKAEEKGRPKELSGVKEDTESCRKKKRLSQGRASEEISGTAAWTRQNRDQRDQPNKEEKVQGDHKGNSDKRKNQGIEGDRHRREGPRDHKGSDKRKNRGIEGDQGSKAKSKGQYGPRIGCC